MVTITERPLTGLQRRVLEYCWETICDDDRPVSAFDVRAGLDTSGEDAYAALREMERRGLLARRPVTRQGHVRRSQSVDVVAVQLPDGRSAWVTGYEDARLDPGARPAQAGA